MPTIELYYSQSLLGHFTIIAYDRVDLVAQRVHLVDRDALSATGAKKWLLHKVKQVTGYATSRVLMDLQSSPTEFLNFVNYARADRPRLKQWHVTVTQFDQMLNWVHRRVQDQNAGHLSSYGYVVYSNNVENCGSFAIRCLAEAGIHVTIPYLKSWLPLPTVIRPDVETSP